MTTMYPMCRKLHASILHLITQRVHFRICHSPNGWTDGELGLEWMIKDFDAVTWPKALGKMRVLFFC